MGPLGFGKRLLWIGFVGPDRCMIKAFSQVPLGAVANAALAEVIMSGLTDALVDFPADTTVAFLLTRPGTGPISRLDRQWAAVLTDVATEHEVRLEPIFRANDDALVQVKPVIALTH
jgi:hypothetical protein